MPSPNGVRLWWSSSTAQVSPKSNDFFVHIVGNIIFIIMTSSHIRGENKKKGEKKIVSLVFDADVYLKNG